MLRFHLPFTLAIATAALGRVLVYLNVEQGGLVQDLWRNVLVESTVIWRYLALLVLPTGLSVVHPVRTVTSPLDPAVIAAAVGYLVVALTLFRLRRRAPLLTFGALWFLLLVAPSHVIPLQEAMAEHRVYTAGGGLFLAAAAGFARFEASLGARRDHRPSWPRAAGVGVLVVLAGLTAARNRVWQDPVTLWGNAARTAPATWAAQYGHAEALRAAGRHAEAVEVYRRAMELEPGMVQPYLNAGISLAETGRLDEAAEVLEQARRLEPDNPKAYNNLGVLAARTGRLEEARDLFREALARDPRNVEARLALAHLYEVAFDDPATALALCEEVRAIAPGTPGVDACVAGTRARLATGR
jgi:tetratricopeptide (TPR) repeat protein